MEEENNYLQIVEELSATYDILASARNKNRIYAWKARERNLFCSELVRLKKNVILDLGAGHGGDAQYFEKHGMSVTCVDISHKMVEICRQKGFIAYEVDFLGMPFDTHSFHAIYTMNSLLHVPKSQIGNVLQRIKDVLSPSGLFYYGVYGGINFEGIWQTDKCEKKRFFNYYTDIDLLNLVSTFFNIVYFRRVPVEGREGLHFQSLILSYS